MTDPTAVPTTNPTDDLTVVQNGDTIEKQVEEQSSLWREALGPYAVRLLSDCYVEIMDELESLGWTFEYTEEGADKTLIAKKGSVQHCCKRMFLSHCVGHLHTVIKYVKGGC